MTLPVRRNQPKYIIVHFLCEYCMMEEAHQAELECACRSFDAFQAQNVELRYTQNVPFGKYCSRYSV